MFSADLARWPSFWPQVTQFRTWPWNHQDKHSEQDSWWLLKQVTPMLPKKFGVNWPLSSGGEEKRVFQDGCHGGHLGFPIGTILAIFDLYVTLMLPTMFGVNLLLGLGEEAKIDFQDGCHGGHLGFLISMILPIFDLQVTPMLPSKFGVNWPLSSGEEAKNRFSRWLPWRPSWISDWHEFS